MRRVAATADAANAPTTNLTPGSPPAATASGTPSAAELERLDNQMQSKVSTIAPELQFLVDKDSGKSIIKLTDRNTSEVVWQFPSEQALQVTRALDRFQKGLMLNRNA